MRGQLARRGSWWLALALVVPLLVSGGAQGSASAAVTTAAPDDTDAAAVLFDPLAVADISLSLDEAARTALAAAPTEYVTGTFAATIGGETYGPWQIGVKLKGHASFRTLAGKAAFKLKFNHVTKSLRLLGLKKLTLNNILQDPSGLHEGLAYDVFRQVGIAAPRVGYARLSVDGQPYGLYADVETVDEVALARWFPATTHLYEGEHLSDVRPGLESTFSVELGSSEDRSDLTGLIDAAATAGPGWRDAVAAVADLDEMVRMWAVEHYVAHWDGYSWGLNNYYLHRDGGGRFTMHPWGTDQTFATDVGFGRIGNPSLLYGRCMADAGCRADYADAVAEVHEAAVGLDLAARAAARWAVIRPELLLDGRRENTQAQADAVYEHLQSFLMQRPVVVTNWLGTPLATPTGLTGAGRPSAVELAWTIPPATGPWSTTDVEIAVRSPGGPWRIVDDGRSVSTTAVVTGLRCCRPHQVRVRARSGDVVSAWSAPVTVSPVREARRPWPPRLVGWRPNGDGAIVAWSAPGSDGGAALDGYTVQLSVNGGAWQTAGSTGAAGRSLALEVRPPGAVRFRVAAVNAIGVGGWANARRRAAITPV